MKAVPFSILAPFAALIVMHTSPARADAEIVVAAPETEVIVEPRAAQRPLVNLPTLDFALRAAFRCRGEAVSLTLSVSDTAQTLSPAELADKRAAEVNLAVPASQVAMAASHAFCIADDPDSANELRITGFATAAASLRCRDNDRDSVRYASAPLTVLLVCARGVRQGVPASAGDR